MRKCLYALSKNYILRVLENDPKNTKTLCEELPEYANNVNVIYFYHAQKAQYYAVLVAAAVHF